MLRHLCSIQANLAFTKDAMNRAVLRAAEILEKDPSIWAHHLTARIRTMCAHTLQAYIKARGCHSSWVHSIMNPGLDL
eukprot:6466513-Amphidinium_carterae.1